MANLRAGLIGLGMMGRHHARVLGGLQGVDLVAVADPGGDQHGVAGGLPVLDSVEELIATGIDYCMVAVPTIYHEPVALALAEAGVHAMIEKPLAQNTPSARKIADAFAARGLVGAVGHIERYNPALQSARARLAAGELGSVYQVTTRRQGPFPARIADVGVVKDLATHDIDLTAWVTQQSFVSVGARTATTVRHVVMPLLRPAIVASLVYAFVRAMTAVSAVIFLVTAEYNMATAYIVGRVEAGEFGIAIAYSCVLIAIMLAVIGLIQLGVGERKLGRRETVALQGAA